MRVAILQALTWGTVTASVASATWLAYQESADTGSRSRMERHLGSAFVGPRLQPAATARAVPSAQRVETQYTGSDLRER